MRVIFVRQFVHLSTHFLRATGVKHDLSELLVFLCVVVRNREEIHGVLDKFLVLLRSVSQEVPARAVDDADVPV